MGNMSIREYLERFDNGEFDSPYVSRQVQAGWYDWFCKESSLRNKTKSLTAKLKQIVNSSKIDQDKMYVFFKNNCPMVGRLYDDFRICDLETGNVIFTIVPRSGHKIENGAAIVYEASTGIHHKFENWTKAKKFFKDK